MYTERTLLISGSEKGLDAITNFLKGCGYAAVSVVSSGDEARRRLQQDTFSLIVLNTPLKDEFGYQLSLQLTQNTCSGVVMLCKVSELYKINRRYEESKEVLLLAYDLQPGCCKRFGWGKRCTVE